MYVDTCFGTSIGTKPLHWQFPLLLYSSLLASLMCQCHALHHFLLPLAPDRWFWLTGILQFLVFKGGVGLEKILSGRSSPIEFTPERHLSEPLHILGPTVCCTSLGFVFVSSVTLGGDTDWLVLWGNWPLVCYIANSVCWWNGMVQIVRSIGKCCIFSFVLVVELEYVSGRPPYKCI